MKTTLHFDTGNLEQDWDVDSEIIPRVGEFVQQGVHVRQVEYVKYEYLKNLTYVRVQFKRPPGRPRARVIHPS